MRHSLAALGLLIVGLILIVYGIIQMVDNKPVPQVPAFHFVTHDIGVDTVLAENARVLARIEAVERAAAFTEGRQMALFGSLLLIWAFGIYTGAPPRTKAAAKS
jgi:hypothetical protein